MSLNTDNEKACSEVGVDATDDENCCVAEVGLLVQKLVRIFQMFERDQIKFYGFTSSQCYALLEILKSENISMNDLSEKMNLDSSTMTRVIDTLVRNGLISRERSLGDKRVVIVSLTDEGKNDAQKLNSSITNYYKKIIANIPQNKTVEILDSVSILIEAFRKANPNCC